MVKQRVFLNNDIYGSWHREALPDLYPRRGEIMDVADRDWTESCHACRDTILIVEELLDVGQDLRKKATKITRKLAARAGVPAFLVATCIDKDLFNALAPKYHDLQRQIREIESQLKPTGFKVRNITKNGPIIKLTPDEWAEKLYQFHREHQHHCSPSKDPIVDFAAYQASARKNIQITGNQVHLPLTNDEAI